MEKQLKYDYRYTHTLCINFKHSVGIGSYGYESDEIFKSEEVKQYFPEATESLEYYKKITENINNIITSVLGNDVLLDWRDDKEIEIHKMPEDSMKTVELIHKLVKYLESLEKS